PRCVYFAESRDDAYLIAGMLVGEGIDAYADSRFVGGWFEVWVLDESDIPRAKEVLAMQGEEARAQHDARRSRIGNVEVVCPGCQRHLTFPAAQQGTVQSCMHCDEYVDVPDPEDTTQWPDDFGQSEYEIKPDDADE